MKVWYLQNHSGRTGKFFFSESAYLKATNSRDTRKVFILEMIDGGVPSNEFSQALFLNRERENQLSTIFGEVDEFTKNFSEFKKIFEELCPDTTAFWTSKKELSKNLKIINDKKSFKSYVSQLRVKKFLLLHVSDSVEWFESILKCHGFQSLPVDKIPHKDIRVKNFFKAKENIKKSK